MKLYELQHYVNELIEQGYGNVPVYFDTEAREYGTHLVEIKSIHIVPKEAIGEDHIILYQVGTTTEDIFVKEEPLIVHNVMKYKGEYYLKQISNKSSCEGCSCFINGGDCIIPEDKQGECGLGTYIWKSFKDIQITDELACMRKDIGDIYVYNIQENKIDKLIHVEDDRKRYVHTLGWRSTNDNIRLATAEEIQK